MDDLAPANDNYKANSPTDVGKGPIYGMVKDFSPDQSLFINQKLFEDAGIAVPGDENADRLSYAQVAEYAAMMTKFDGERLVSYGYGPEWGWIGRMIQNMIVEKNVDLYTKDFEKVVIKDSEETTKAVKWYYDMAANKYCQSTINPSPNGWTGTDFTTGVLGMIQYGYWFSAMAFTEESHVKMLPAASWAGKDRNPCTTATGMVMIKATQNAEAAWKVFEYYNAGQPSIDRAKSGWGVPGLKSQFALMPQETDFQKQAYKVVMNEIALEDAPLQFNPYLNNNSWNAVWGPNLDLALTGSIDFDGFLTNLETEINQLIMEGKETVDASAV
jgi:multiple sugar transport system substrate-binding protein